MNEVKTKRRWEEDTWTLELQSKFQKVKDLFTDPASACRTHPMAPRVVPGRTHQVQHGVTQFIGAKGRKCRAYEQNYHSSKGELLALDYRLKKFSKFLHKGPFTVRSDNSTVIHWETMSADKNVSPYVKRWLENFSLFNMKLVHMPGKLIPVDHLSWLNNLPSAVGFELNSSDDFEPRYPLPHPSYKINKILYIESADKERVIKGAFSETAPSMLNGAESTRSSQHSEATTGSTASGITGSFNP